MDVSVSALATPSAPAMPYEIVEHKGLGHPDTICDELAENLSAGLSRFYLERFGAILHHNVDKALLVGGASRAQFGGGEVLEPIEIYLGGRATRQLRGVTVPVDELAVELSRAWLGAHLRHLDPVRHVRILPRVRPTSAELAELFLRQREGAPPLANDTSIGAGFAPLDALERAVLGAGRALNGEAARSDHPAIGEDIKVMGVRRGERIGLTVACALVGRHLKDLSDYRGKKADVARLAREGAGTGCEVEVNTADGDTPESVYLTVTGLSAEAGDDGQVGRGNRINGLITPYRPMSLEAVAGKNPVTHVGKLYNLLAQRIAQDLAARVAGVEEASCHLVSQIGRPITEPQIVDLKVRLAGTQTLASVRQRLADLAREQIAGLPQLWREVLGGDPADHPHQRR